MKLHFVRACNYCTKETAINAAKWLWYYLLRNKQRTLHYKENTLCYGGGAYRFARIVAGLEVK